MSDKCVPVYYYSSDHTLVSMYKLVNLVTKDPEKRKFLLSRLPGEGTTIVMEFNDQQHGRLCKNSSGCDIQILGYNLFKRDPASKTINYDPNSTAWRTFSETILPTCPRDDIAVDGVPMTTCVPSTGLRVPVYKDVTSDWKRAGGWTTECVGTPCPTPWVGPTAIVNS